MNCRPGSPKGHITQIRVPASDQETGDTRPMSDLKPVERAKLEDLLGMASGYVLNFTNNSFDQFVAYSTGKDIYDEKYNYGSGSKANRLRAFWDQESNGLVGRLLLELLELAEHEQPAISDSKLFLECQRIAERLLASGPAEHLEELSDDLSGPEFELIVATVKEAIEKNAPETGLDRLHTLTIKYVRLLCVNHGIEVDRSKSLNAVFGEYVKALSRDGWIESPLTERILKSAIGLLEAFNQIRNQRSLAHDNELLGFEESMLVFNQVFALLRFVRSVEEKTKAGVVDRNEE